MTVQGTQSKLASNESNQNNSSKTQKHVDIKKGIFRSIRKFWKNYKKN